MSATRRRLAESSLLWLGAIVLGSALSCASVSVNDPRFEADELRAERDARIGPEFLERFKTLRARVRDVSYTLRTKATNLCGSLVLRDSGLLIATQESFGDGDLKGIAERAYALGAGVTVIHVVPGSPLARAGVAAGDRLLSVDGVAVDSTKDLDERLFEASDAAPIFAFRRNNDEFTARAALPDACAVPVSLSPDLGLMTYESKSRIAVPYGLLDAIGDDDMLAIAIAHQMAHFLIGFAEQPVDDVEGTADRLGLLIAQAADFDVAKAVPFWEWLASEDPWRIRNADGFRITRPHPFLERLKLRYPADQLHVGIGERLPRIRAIARELVQVAER